MHAKYSRYISILIFCIFLAWWTYTICMTNFFMANFRNPGTASLSHPIKAQDIRRPMRRWCRQPITTNNNNNPLWRHRKPIRNPPVAKWCHRPISWCRRPWPSRSSRRRRPASRSPRHSSRPASRACSRWDGVVGRLLTKGPNGPTRRHISGDNQFVSQGAKSFWAWGPLYLVEKRSFNHFILTLIVKSK